MFYLSACIAIVSAVGYQYFVKRVLVSLNPVVSVIGMYVAILALSVVIRNTLSTLDIRYVAQHLLSSKVV
jgi:hypothetical protein